MTLDLSFGGFIWPPGQYELPQNPFQCFFNKFQKWLTRFIPKSSSKCLPISVFCWSTGSIHFCRIFPPGRSGEENGNLSHITTRENQFFLFCSFSMSRQQQNAFSVPPPPASRTMYFICLLPPRLFTMYIHVHTEMENHINAVWVLPCQFVYTPGHIFVHIEREISSSKKVVQTKFQWRCILRFSAGAIGWVLLKNAMKRRVESFKTSLKPEFHQNLPKSRSNWFSWRFWTKKNFFC